MPALERSVSRQIEADIYDYYGWQPYWGTDFLMGGYGYGTGIGGAAAALAIREPRRRAEDIATAQARDNDPHLRSVEAVSGGLGGHLSSRTALALPAACGIGRLGAGPPASARSGVLSGTTQ